MISSQSHQQGQDYADVITETTYNDTEPNHAVAEHLNYPPDTSNHSSMMMLHDMREQIEFYFSINNFPRDTFLQQMVSTHQGSVPIAVIAQFPKVQQLYHGMMQYYYANNPSFVAPIEVMVCRSLGSSRLIDVSNDGFYLRPNWMLLQDQDASQSHLRPAGALYNENGQPPMIKASVINHTDATNTTVSPTSFASGSDGSVGQASTGGETAINTNKLHPQTLPVMFNPTGGVYYIPPLQSYHYPFFPGATAYHPHNPSMGVVPHSYPVATSAYRPNLEQQIQHHMPQHQYAQPAPHPQYFNQPPPPQQLLPQQGPVYLDVQTMNEPYPKDQSSRISPESGIRRSVPSPASLNAPPSVIRLQDPFHDDTIYPRNVHKHSQQRHQGNRKKNRAPSNKKRLNRQSSSDTSSHNNSAGITGLSHGEVPTRPQHVSNASQRIQTQATEEAAALQGSIAHDMPISSSNGAITNQTKTDDTNYDGNVGFGVPILKKEKNRIASSHQNRTSTSRPQPPHRGLPSNFQTSKSRHDDNARGVRGGIKYRTNNNNTTAGKKEENILIDENFPSLSKGANIHSVGNKATLVEECNKKKYAEAVLYNPGVPNVVSSQAAAGAVSTITVETGTESGTNGDGHADLPAVTNLLDKFNLHN